MVSRASMRSAKSRRSAPEPADVARRAGRPAYSPASAAAEASVADATTAAIKWIVQQNNSASAWTPIQQQGYWHKFNATGGGDIEVVVTTANTAKYALDTANKLQFAASSGAIRVNFGTGIDLASATSANSIIFGADGTDVSSSSSNITISGNNFVDNANAGSVIVKTSGTVAVQPSVTAGLFTGSQSFSATQAFDSTWSFTGITGTNGGYIGGLVLGQAGTGGASQNKSDITIGVAITAAGPINVYGKNIILNSALVISNASTILVKATADITTATAITFSTVNGNFTFWADSDANSDGHVTVANSNTFNTGGGKFTVAGGADDGSSGVESGRTAGDNLPDAYVWGNSGQARGIQFGNNTAINTSGGNIFVAGHGENLSSRATGGVYFLPGSTVEAGSGKIHIYGQNNNASSANQFSEGVELQGIDGAFPTKPMSFYSSNTASDAIVIVGDSSASLSTTSVGIATLSWANRTGGGPRIVIANTAGGGITLTGRGGNTPRGDITDLSGDGLELNGTAILAKSGTITLNGDTNAANNSINYGVSFNKTTYVNAGVTYGNVSYVGSQPSTTINSVDMSTSTANIVVNSDSMLVTSSTYATTFNTSGTVTIQPATNAVAQQSFDRAIDISTATFGSSITGLTVGQSGTGGVTSGSTQNAADVTLGAAAIAGPVRVYAGNKIGRAHV